jgi:hypothetical protein
MFKTTTNKADAYLQDPMIGTAIRPGPQIRKPSRSDFLASSKKLPKPCAMSANEHWQLASTGLRNNACEKHGSEVNVKI